jgi:hypothetical protein
MVTALSVRQGFHGDDRGRLCWADVLWTCSTPPPDLPIAQRHPEVISEHQAHLRREFPDYRIWFGPATLTWWACPPKDARGVPLIEAPTATALGDELRRRQHRGSQPR